MADLAYTVYEYEHEKHKHQQQSQQLRGLSSSSSSSSSAQLYSLPQQQLQMQSYGSASTSAQIQQLPKQELSLQELNPFPESVFSYTLFLASTIILWVLYLLLPRGVRKQYCRANRKRYARRLDDSMPAAGYWAPVHALKAQSTASGASSSQYSSPAIVSSSALRHNNSKQSTSSKSSNSKNSNNNYSPESPPRKPKSPATLKHPPSPEHPALKRIPPNKIIAETMARLQGRGIRLVAHGVHCDPKRVWIRLQEDADSSSEPSVTWQTEFPRRVPDQNGNVSIVLMRGSLHSIALKNILYIDVGKKTHALALAKGVPDNMCLSLLTQNGSLDLQANSKLERDSLVSCFSMILDDIHDEDWRALYEQSPEPSIANSSTVFSSGGHSLLGTANKLVFETPGSSMGKLGSPSPLQQNTASQQKKAAMEEKDRMLQLL